MSHEAKLRRRAAERPEINRVTSAIGLMEREGVTAGSLAFFVRILGCHPGSLSN